MPRPSRFNARFVLQSFPRSQRFRADEITAARRRRFGGSPAHSGDVRAGARPLRSTTWQAGPLRRGRCLHRPAKLPAIAMLGVHIPFFRSLPPAAGLPGGRNRPPYNTRQTAGETGNFAFAADVSFPGTHLRESVGRAFTPAARPSGCRGVSGPMKITATRRRRFGGSPARSAGVRAGDRPLRMQQTPANPQG